jgi:L-fuculose-phosphate aldolase
MENTFKQERKEVARYMRRLYKRELTTASGGNISVKVGDYVLITPSQIDKGNLKGKDIAIIDMNGKVIKSKHKLSMETKMHLEIYKARPDISAVVHSHPVFSSAFACSNEEVDTTLSGEILYMCGVPKRAEYKLMGSEELAEVVSETTKDTDLVIMDNHGIVAVGTTLFKAFDKIEVYENAAKINYYGKMLGKMRQLPLPDQDVIMKM